MKKSDRNKTWGHCGHCRFFDSPAKTPLDGEEAACNEPTLSKAELRVFGTSGCNRFEIRPGLPKTLEEPRIGA
jgi:heat shock protein HslJ